MEKIRKYCNSLCIPIWIISFAFITLFYPFFNTDQVFTEKNEFNNTFSSASFIEQDNALFQVAEQSTSASTVISLLKIDIPLNIKAYTVSYQNNKPGKSDKYLTFDTEYRIILCELFDPIYLFTHSLRI